MNIYDAARRLKIPVRASGGTVRTPRAVLSDVLYRARRKSASRAEIEAAIALSERRAPGRRLGAHPPDEPRAVRRLDEWRDQRRAAAERVRLDEFFERARRAEQIAARWRAVVRARGGETEIVGQRGAERLAVADERDGLVLIACDGWRQYSRAFGARRARLAYLCGTDDSGDWAVRVAGTVSTVDEALRWITPQPVRRAQERGAQVLRQGDVYAVRCRDGLDQRGERIGGRHDWSSDGRWLLHPEHRPLQIPWPARIYQQRAYQMGRTGRRGAAD